MLWWLLVQLEKKGNPMLNDKGEIVTKLTIDKETPGTYRFSETKTPAGHRKRSIYLTKEDCTLLGDPITIEMTIRPIPTE